MPNDNLGTAHGRIRLDLDDKASGKLLSTLVKLSRQFDQMNNRLKRIEKAVNSTDKTFDKTSKTIDRTTKATRGFADGLFSANRNVTKLSKDMGELYENFNKFANVIEKVSRYYGPLSRVYRVLDQLENLRFDAATNSLNRFNRSLGYAGLTWRTFGREAARGLFGVKAAMADMPVWTQNLNRVAGQLGRIGAIAFGISKIAGADPFGKLLNTKAFERLALASEGAGLSVQRFSQRSSKGLQSFSRVFSDVSKPIGGFANSIQGAVLGAALLAAGIEDVVEKFAFLRAIPSPILKGLALMISRTLPVALSVLSKALTGTSNILLGLLDGVKQLSGGLLVLPGIFASIGAVASSLFPVFKGLGDKFKGIFDKDYTKRWEAFWALPEHLRPLGKVLQDLQPKWEKFVESLQKTAFDKVEQQIQRIADNYLPLWEKGAKRVIIAVRGIKDEFVAFLGQQQTMQDVSQIYATVANGLNNLKGAVGPVLSGLRDIATVGVGFIRDMSSYMPVLLRQFEQWASTNRNNGNLLRWMQDARAGVYDLIKGTSELTQGLWSMLTVFRSNQGTDGLARFADSMERFNQAVQRSAATGVLRNIGNAVREMADPGADVMDDFVGSLRDFGDMMEAIWEVVKGTSDAFTAQFLPALRTFMGVIEFLANLKSSLGLDTLVGSLLGLWAAFKLGDRLLHGIFGGVKAVVGAFMLLRNTSKIAGFVDKAFTGLAFSVAQLGDKGSKLGTSMFNVRQSLASIIPVVSRVAGGMAAVVLAIGTGYLLWENRNKAIKDGMDQIAASTQHTKEAGDAIKEAFIDDGGLAGRTVMDSVSQGIDTMFADLESATQKAPGMAAHIGDRIRDAFTIDEGEGIMEHLFGRKGGAESEAINTIQKAAADAQLAQENFKRAGATQDDLRRAVMGSAESYQQLRHRLMESGAGANEAIAQIDALRKQYQEAAAAAKELGDGGVQVAAGIRKIAEAGGDAVSKLEGLRDVLEGLGLLKTSALEAAAAYEKGIDDLASSVAEVVSKGASLSDLVDQNTGSFNVGTEAGRGLFDVLKSLGDEFLATSAKNGNTQESYKKFEEQLGSLQTSTGLTREQLIKLAGDVGILPKEVSIALADTGGDTVLDDIKQIVLQAQAAAGKGVEVAVGVQNDPQVIAKKINDIVGRAVATVGEKGNVLLKPDLSLADLNKVQQELANRGVGTPGFTPKPATLDVKVNTPGIGNALGKTDADIQKERENLNNNLDGMLADIAGATGQASDQADDAGRKFVDEYARGLGSNDAARDAARKMAEDVLRQFHQSPPKEGPLKRHGDAARYGGEQFTTAYATGITSRAAEAGGAASNVAGAASAGLKGDKMYQTGQFLGQLSQLVDFASNFVDVFDKLSQTILGFTKYLSDPLGKGTFFGKSMGFKRDPTISDTQLAQNRADAAQQRLFGFYDSGQRPDLYDPSTGRLKAPSAPGDLVTNASRQQIANYIIDKALAAGYSREQANQFLIQAVGESNGLDPKASNPAGWEGIFQFDTDTWKLAGGGDVQNAQQNIDNFFKLAEIRGLTPENFKDPSQLGTQVSIGGPLHPENAAKGHLANAQKNAQAFIQAYQAGAGQLTSGIPTGMPSPSQLANLTGSKLRKGEGVEAGLEPAAALTAALLSNMFPGITDIGGRQDRTGPQMHPKGRALDVMTGGDAALGDRIAEFVKQNYAQFGIQSFIWRDTGLNLVANEGGGPGSTYTAGGHGGPSGTNAGSHVHIQFADGATVDMSGSGTNIKVPADSPYAKNNYGLPPTPEDLAKPTAPRDLVVQNPDGTFSPIHVGDAAKPGPDFGINAVTGKPWTPEESAEFWNRPENRMQYDRSQLQPGDQGLPGVYNGPQDNLLDEFKQSNQFLAGILDGTNAQLTESEAISAANQLQTEIDRQNALNTAASRARASKLQGVQSQIASDYGLTQEQNPIDQAAGIISNVSGVAGSIFQAINSGIEAIGATKDIADTLVRYPSNTEDVFRMIDDFQKYIKFAADIAGATSQVLSMVGSFIPASAGGADFGGAAAAKTAVEGASQIAAMIQAALETVNAVIDLGQEAYRIFGSYFGDFLGYLVGGADALRGDIQFLLDTQTNQLLTYSQDNPLDKRAHGGIGGTQNINTRNQVARDIYMFAGPGTDPRDSTRQMMLQLKMNQMSAPVGQ